jgi:hypothetical protein
MLAFSLGIIHIARNYPGLLNQYEFKIASLDIHAQKTGILSRF